MQGEPGFSNCYVFKCRLQEYAQKVGISTPVYDTIAEGPSHEPNFRSTVIVDNVKYHSLPGFSSRKASEQSAAEVALVELAKSGHINQSNCQPVEESGLCKNLLQEYAQKMNFAVPTYGCQTNDGHGRTPSFSCTVQIDGIRYAGAAAKSKKEAEIKAARTALIAIQSSEGGLPEKPDRSCQLTVVPGKRKVTQREKVVRSPTPNKGRLKKRRLNRKFKKAEANGIPKFGLLECYAMQPKVESSNGNGFQVEDSYSLAVGSAYNGVTNSDHVTGEISIPGDSLVLLGENHL